MVLLACWCSRWWYKATLLVTEGNLRIILTNVIGILFNEEPSRHCCYNQLCGYLRDPDPDNLSDDDKIICYWRKVKWIAIEEFDHEPDDVDPRNEADEYVCVEEDATVVAEAFRKAVECANSGRVKEALCCPVGDDDDCGQIDNVRWAAEE